MSSVDCLPEPALWPAAEGKELDPTAAAHLRCCAACAARVRILKQQRQLLREVATSGGLEGSYRLDQPTPAEPVTGHIKKQQLRRAAAEPCMADSESRRQCPEQIGPYKPVRLLKVGGQADVFLAKHPSHDTSVVVKWAHAAWRSSPELTDRFSDEARLLSQLKHPRLVRVYDAGIAEQRPFLVLEFVDGCELSRYRERPMSAPDAARLMAKVARTVHVVHQAGWLHLDVQPDNILVDRHGQPRLIDFGASMRLHTGRQCWRRGPGCGTPEYMPPEQLAGQFDQLDVTTDVYALAAVLYELLVGTPPRPEVCWDRPNSPGQRTCVNAAPAALLRICRQALDPVPAHRPSTALKFAQALERFDAWNSRTLRIVVAALAALWSAMAVLLWPRVTASGRNDSHPASNSRADETSLPPDALREIVKNMLQRAAEERRRAFIVLADGRVLPLHLDQRRTGSGDAAAAPAAVLPTLLNLTGTNLLVIDLPRGDRVDGHNRKFRRLRTCLPSLSPQAGVWIDSRTVAGVARTPAGVCHVDSARWRAVQLELSQWSTDFSALAFRTAAGSIRRIIQGSEPPPQSATPSSPGD